MTHWPNLDPSRNWRCNDCYYYLRWLPNKVVELLDTSSILLHDISIIVFIKNLTISKFCPWMASSSGVSALLFNEFASLAASLGPFSIKIRFRPLTKPVPTAWKNSLCFEFCLKLSNKNKYWRQYKSLQRNNVQCSLKRRLYSVKRTLSYV